MASKETARDTIADAYTETTEAFANVNGDRIPYLFSGNSEKAVLLAHGAGASRSDWREVIPTLVKSGSVYAPDLIGFGDTVRREFPHTPQYIADYLIGFMDAVGIETATLVGHSLGGRVCLELALTYPERVSGMVLEAPMGFGKISWQGRAFSLARWSLCVAAGLKSPYPPLDFPTVEKNPTRFQSITCETLLLWGTRDLYFRHQQGLTALKQIPNSRLKIYDGAGHSLHRSTPSRFSADVTLFLNERKYRPAPE